MRKMAWLIVALLMAGCSAKSVEEEPDPETLRSSLKPTEVKVVKAIRKPFTYSIQTSGRVEAARQVELIFKVSGLLDRLNIVNGQYVRKGDLLAQLEDKEFSLGLRKAESALKQRNYQFQNDILGYSPGELDGDRGAVIKESIRHSSGLADAEISHEEAKLRYGYAKIIAPLSGIVANLEIKQGNYINAGDELCILYDPSALEVNTHILEGDLAQLKKELKAKLKTIGSTQEYEAVISEINPQVEEDGTVKVKLRLTNSKGMVPGMNVQVAIAVPQNETIVVPKDAVIIRSGREVVFVEDNGLAKWNYVTVGLDNGEEVEILEGIEAGVDVIVTNNLQLAHDAPVVVEKI